MTEHVATIRQQDGTDLHPDFYALVDQALGDNETFTEDDRSVIARAWMGAVADVLMRKPGARIVMQKPEADS